MQQKELTIVMVILLLVAAAAGWYVWSAYQSPVPAPQTTPIAVPSSTTPAPQKTQVTTSSLGASLLEKSQNPIQNKVPSVAPAPNPIKDAYKNPFE